MSDKERLNPWIIEIRNKDSYNIRLDLVNEDTGEIKVLELNVNTINEIIESNL